MNLELGNTMLNKNRVLKKDPFNSHCYYLLKQADHKIISSSYSLRWPKKILAIYGYKYYSSSNSLIMDDIMKYEDIRLLDIPFPMKPTRD